MKASNATFNTLVPYFFYYFYFILLLILFSFCRTYREQIDGDIHPSAYFRNDFFLQNKVIDKVKNKNFTMFFLSSTNDAFIDYLVEQSNVSEEINFDVKRFEAMIREFGNREAIKYRFQLGQPYQVTIFNMRQIQSNHSESPINLLFHRNPYLFKKCGKNEDYTYYVLIFKND